MLTNNSHGGNHNLYPSHHNQNQSVKQQSNFQSKNKISQGAVNASGNENRENNDKNYYEFKSPENKRENDEFYNEFNEDDDEDRAFKEIDDLYEYVRSGVLPDYLKTIQIGETLGMTTVNSRSKIISQTATIPSSANVIHEHSSPSSVPQVPFQEHSDHHLIYHHNQNLYQNNQNKNSHHNSLQNQNILSSVTAVTTTVSGGGGNGDETRDHSELFDISTTTNTRKTYKLSQKNSENVSGSSSFRYKKGKG